jgi:hypothetical protein
VLNAGAGCRYGGGALLKGSGERSPSQRQFAPVERIEGEAPGELCSKGGEPAQQRPSKPPREPLERSSHSVRSYNRATGTIVPKGTVLTLSRCIANPGGNSLPGLLGWKAAPPRAVRGLARDLHAKREQAPDQPTGVRQKASGAAR